MMSRDELVELRGIVIWTCQLPARLDYHSCLTQRIPGMFHLQGIYYFPHLWQTHILTNRATDQQIIFTWRPGKETRNPRSDIWPRLWD